MYYKVTTTESGAAGALRMHSTPDTDASSVIGSVPHGAIVQPVLIAPDQNGMRYVSYEGNYGWVSIAYLTECDSEGNTTSSTDKRTNVVPTDNSSSEIITADGKQNGKKWLIIGGLALAVGAMMNVFM